MVTDRHVDTKIVPRDSLVSEGGEWYVFLAEQGQAKKVPVQLGFEEADRVELVEGPDYGQSVVVTGAAALQDGMPIEVIEPKPAGEASGKSKVDEAG